MFALQHGQHLLALRTRRLTGLRANGCCHGRLFENDDSRQPLQKLWPQGVEMGAFISFSHRGHSNSVTNQRDMISEYTRKLKQKNSGLNPARKEFHINCTILESTSWPMRHLFIILESQQVWRFAQISGMNTPSPSRTRSLSLIILFRDSACFKFGFSANHPHLPWLSWEQVTQERFRWSYTWLLCLSQPLEAKQPPRTTYKLERKRWGMPMNSNQNQCRETKCEGFHKVYNFKKFLRDLQHF
jgi:hypothetical protein